MRLFFLSSLVISIFSSSFYAQPRPAPAQLAWHDTEFYLFFHFGPNTFTDLEWGHGNETEELFNPTALDCNQWCRVAKAAGAKGVIITAKHHDGFCLWPSQYSTHTVRESKWRQGKGDVLRELADAARRHGLKLGFYLSPWDRNHPQYGTPAYNDVYAYTLRELLGNYGELFEIWWDGANGEGPNGKRQVYDFHRFEKIAAAMQPDAVIFSDIGPGCRWAGNEEGLIRTETNWCTLDTAGFQRGAGGPPQDTLNRGNVNGTHWIPAECDVSIRPGWFYHAAEDDKVKSPEQLWQIYLHSVGRGANLILNVPPDRRGLIHENDAATLIAFGDKLRTAFSNNLLKNIPAQNGTKVLTDGQRTTSHPAKPVLQFDLGKKQSFNALLVCEHIAEGQRIAAFSVEIKEGKKWREVARSTTIGARKIVQFPEVTAQKLRIKVLGARDKAALTEVELYRF